MLFPGASLQRESENPFECYTPDIYGLLREAKEKAEAEKKDEGLLY